MWLEGAAGTTAANHLFDVYEEAKKLIETKALLYHHNVAKLLFLSKRARLDVQTAVIFMCNRLTHPDVDDMKKLKRFMRYLQLTKYLPLALETNGDMHLIKFWVNV